MTAGGTYGVEVSGCGTDQTAVSVVETTVVADIVAAPVVGEAPLEVVFSHSSVPSSADLQRDLCDGTTYSGPTTTHTYAQPGAYSVVLTATANGCSDTDSLLVLVNDPMVDSEIYVPNVFSPNGDGQNDVWGPVAVGLAKLTAQVYNRWGQLVAELRAPGQVWDGRTEAGEPASEGTYYYILDAEGADGRTYNFTGTVTLLR